jgi:hypothetical protein
VWTDDIHTEKSCDRSHFSNSKGLAELCGEIIDRLNVFAENEDVVDVNCDNDKIWRFR